MEGLDCNPGIGRKELQKLLEYAVTLCSGTCSRELSSSESACNVWGYLLSIMCGGNLTHANAVLTVAVRHTRGA
jgi:hypothetical protein